MATKKQKRLAGELKQQKNREESIASGLAAQQKDRQQRERAKMQAEKAKRESEKKGNMKAAKHVMANMFQANVGLQAGS